MKAYHQFCKIIYQWLRFAELFIGHDVFSNEFQIHSYTITVLCLAWTLLILFVWTAYHYDGELQLIAMATIGVGIKVLQIQ